MRGTIIGLVILLIVLAVLLTPFVPVSDYEVGYDYTMQLSWGTTCVVKIKDNGIGGDYTVRMYVGDEEKVAIEHIEPGEARVFQEYFSDDLEGDCEYEVDAPVEIRSILEVIAG
jgi:hypothetical protein